MADESRDQRLLELFGLGAELPRTDRAAFCERHCAGDDELRRELEALLGVADGVRDEFLVDPLSVVRRKGETPPAAVETPTPASEPSGSTDRALPELPGHTVLERLAEGGMGTVYLAEQTGPIHRRVVVKMIRPGLDCHRVLARFEAERQALARMSHRCVARIFEAGENREGRPFVTMEYVDGPPINAYCDAARLTTNERLELFVDVCHGVQHAHQRGVLHRDLKPSNLLVAEEDGEPVPKVIDFGIAKALERPLGEQSLHTEIGTFMGTPEYMSPEQANPGALAVDTRSDVYSLGVVLFELLTGRLPFAPERLRRSSVFELYRILNEEPPPRPSACVTRFENPSEIAEKHQTELHTLQRRLRGDLDWIVLKALEKEPDRRYASPLALAEDIERYLRHEPVEASPPSRFYRARKYVRRHAVAVTAGVLLLITLLTGITTTTYYLLRATQSAEEARDERDAAVRANREAQGMRLATEAMMATATDPERGLLLALEAAELTSDPNVNQALHQNLAAHPQHALLVGHEALIANLDFSPDSRFLASVGQKPTAMLWDVEGRRLHHRLIGHRGNVNDVCFHPSGRQLLTVSEDGTARLWETESGALIRTYELEAGAIFDVAFSPDGASFATAHDDGTARLVSLDGRTRHVLRGCGPAMIQVAFDPRGEFLLTTGAETRLWNLADGSLVSRGSVATAERIELHRSVTRRGSQVLRDLPEIEWSPDGSHFAVRRKLTKTHYTVTLHRRTGEVVHVIEGYPVHFCAFTSDGRRLLASRRKEGELGECVAYDLADGQLRTIAIPGITLRRASPTDARIGYGIANEITGNLVDLETGEVLCEFLGHNEYCFAAGFSPSGVLVATGSKDGTLRLWNVHSPERAIHLGGFTDRGALASTPGGTPVVTTDGAGKYAGASSVWMAETRERVGLLPKVENGYLIQVLPDGSGLMRISARKDYPLVRGNRRCYDTVEVLSLQGEPRLRFQTAVPFTKATVRQDGGAVALHSYRMELDEPMPIHDLSTGRRTHRVPLAGDANTVAWSAGPAFERLAIVYSPSQRTDLVELSTGRVVSVMQGPGGGWHMSAAISPDGRHVLTAAADGRTTLWDAESGQLVASHRSERGKLLCGFTPSGHLAWSIGAYEALLFEAGTGQVVSRMSIPTDSILQWAGISHDGDYLLAVTYRDTRLFRWSLDPLTTARARVSRGLTRAELDAHRIGTPEERERREREEILRRQIPRELDRLAARDLERGATESALALLRQASALGPADPLVHARLSSLLSQRIRDGVNHDAAQTAAEHEEARAALGKARAFGCTSEQLHTLPALDLVLED
ncbi:MAG: protein kinase [Planctomycetes bacterium]|nr:protein kinase [Planctomycetota bacterium]